jgi:hypothetical protein
MASINTAGIYSATGGQMFNASGNFVNPVISSGSSLTLQTANTTAVTVDTLQNVTFAGYINSPNTFGFRNRIINGAMVIDQRNAGASFTNSNAAVYGVDRWVTYGITSAVLTCQQVTDAPSGFSNSFKLTVSTATTANDGGVFPAQKIEASNCTDLMWGTSTAATITVSFWVKASVTGTYNTSFIFYGPSSLYYVSTFTVNSANTWEYKTVTVAGPTTGGAFSGASNAAYLAWYTVTIGSTGNTTYATPNTWSSSTSPKSSGTVNIGSTLNATLQIVGCQLEKGSTATSFDYRPYGTELALCQRYYEIIQSVNNIGHASQSVYDGVSGGANFRVEKRATPTVTRVSGTAINRTAGSAGSNTGTPDNVTQYGFGIIIQSTSGAGIIQWINGSYTSSAEL